METTFYMVLNANTSRTQKRHTSYESALNEAKRLAMLQPEDDFIVLQSKALVHAPKVAVVEYDKSHGSFNDWPI